MSSPARSLFAPPFAPRQAGGSASRAVAHAQSPLVTGHVARGRALGSPSRVGGMRNVLERRSRHFDYLRRRPTGASRACSGLSALYARNRWEGVWVKRRIAEGLLLFPTAALAAGVVSRINVAPGGAVSRPDAMAMREDETTRTTSIVGGPDQGLALRCLLLAAVSLACVGPAASPTLRTRPWEGAPLPPRSAGLDKFPLTCDGQRVRADMAVISAMKPCPSPAAKVAAIQGGKLRHAVAMIIGRLDVPEANLADGHHPMGSLEHASLGELRSNFGAVDEHLLAPHNMSFVFMYDFPALPEDEVSMQLGSLFSSLLWTRPPGEAAAEGDVDGEWRSPRGTRLLVKGRRFELPLYIQRAPELLERNDWLSCHGRKFSASYNLYSGAIWSHHLFFEPLLDQFDFVFKIDLDIKFLRRAPIAPASVMQEQGCLFLHTSINGRDTDCQDGVFQATVAFSQLLDTSPASAKYQWCQEPHYFYGNFIGYNMYFQTTPAQLYFSRWLYECFEEGYFRHRWGDQASYPMYLCLARDIPDLRNSSDVCSLESWRNDVFKH